MCICEVGGVCPSFPGFILSISISDQSLEKISIYLWSLGSHLHPAGAWSQADTREQLSHKLANVAHLLRLGFSKPFLEHLVLIFEYILPFFLLMLRKHPSGAPLAWCRLKTLLTLDPVEKQRPGSGAAIHSLLLISDCYLSTRHTSHSKIKSPPDLQMS